MNNREFLYNYSAKYLTNYDGDTVDFLVDLGFNTQRRTRVRLLECQCEEMRTKSIKSIAAKTFTQTELETASEIFIHTEKPDSFGRYLARVLYNSPNGWRDLAVELKHAGLATEYKRG